MESIKLLGLRRYRNATVDIIMYCSVYATSIIKKGDWLYNIDKCGLKNIHISWYNVHDSNIRITQAMKKSKSHVIFGKCCLAHDIV